ncbi:hypothetical protein OAO01_09725, partial [Oligoflexia bacterium]|nr:hypothetical protein [Oligoflexia bacterium]
FLYAFTLLYVCIGTSTLASPLEQVLTSNSLHQMEENTRYILHQRRTTGDSRKVDKLDPVTNFGSLFHEKAGNIVTWLISKASRIHVGPPAVRREKEHLLVQSQLASKKLPRVILKMLIPDPRFVEVIDLGLVKAFTDLKPDVSAIKKQKEIVVGSTTGVLYELKNEECSFQIKIARDTVVELFVAKCDAPEALAAMAKQLRIQRANRMLNS